MLRHNDGEAPVRNDVAAGDLAPTLAELMRQLAEERAGREAAEAELARRGQVSATVRKSKRSF